VACAALRGSQQRLCRLGFGVARDFIGVDELCLLLNKLDDFNFSHLGSPETGLPTSARSKKGRRFEAI
jgi:hypothetical protein